MNQYNRGFYFYLVHYLYKSLNIASKCSYITLCNSRVAPLFFPLPKDILLLKCHVRENSRMKPVKYEIPFGQDSINGTISTEGCGVTSSMCD